MIDGARDTIPRWPLTLMRVYAGLVLLGAAAVGRSSPAPASVAVLEMVAGVALVLGIATPAAALLALGIVVANVLPLHGFSILISPGPRTAFAVLLLTVGLARAGRWFGLDRVLRTRFPRVPLW